MIGKGDRVKVVRIAPDCDDLTRSNIGPRLGHIGIVITNPSWLPYEPEKGSLGEAVANGEVCVRFSDDPRDIDIFEVWELEKIE